VLRRRYAATQTPGESSVIDDDARIHPEMGTQRYRDQTL
jgi:hypothetical protein